MKEYAIQDIDKIQIGDYLVLDIDAKTGGFPDEYSDLIKTQNEKLKAEMAAFVYSKDKKVYILFKDKNFKKIGIVCDNYKLEKMRMELSKKGYKCIDIKPYLDTTTTITIDVPKDQFQKCRDEIYAVVSSVESHFKRRN